MSARSNPDLSRLAESISDGVKIDWHSDADQVGSQTRSALYILEQIAQMHREGNEPAPVAEEVSGTEMWGPLQVGELLGEGGFGHTHRAFDPMLRREVALKRAHQGEVDVSLRAWVEEARRLARVRHPNVLSIYGARIYEGQAGIWTELIDGRSLSEVVKDGGAMSASEARTIGIDLCSALSAVHQAGLVHGDVKPGNVLRERGGRIVLLDFGSSRELGDAKLQAGSPAFLAPELVAGEPATVRSDVYALGVTLYFLVTGQYPVERTLENLQDTDSALIPLRDRRADLPADFVQVINRALAENPADRFGSAAELEAALQDGSARGAGARWQLAGIVATMTIAVLLSVVLLRGGVPATISAGAEVNVLRQSTSGTGGTVASGDTLALGDRLSLQLVADQASHAYVFNEDEKGDAYVLFPLPHLDTTNPLSAGDRHELPGAVQGEKMFWQVTSAGGSERFVVILSPRPLPIIDDALRQWKQAGAPAPAIAIPEITLRGVGGLTTSPATSEESRLDRLLEQLPDDSAVQLTEFLFRNPSD